MNENEIMQIRLSRINASLEGMIDIARLFLAGLNGVNSTGDKAITAFDMLERFVYNSLGVLPLLKKFETNHNMSVPLSHIFRAMTYNVAISYWLFEEGNIFIDRLRALNGDYIKKNSRRLAVFTAPERLQAVWRNWQVVSPDNFTENADGILQLSTAVSPTFESICEQVNQQRDEHFLKSLPNLYALLSQQTHVSTFSKLIVYDRYDSIIHAFDAICRAVLPTCLLLLREIEGADSIQPALTELLDRLYPNTPEPS